MKRPSIADNFDQSWCETLSGCWEFKHYRNRYGYGQLRARGKVQHAHRFSWQFYVGPINAGLDVLHHCDNRACVNPKHLYLGTDADNVRDRENRGRGRKDTRKGVGKINFVLAKSIRQEYSQGGKTYAEVGALFGLKKSQIGNIISRRCWPE